MAVASLGAFCIGEYPEAVAVMLFYQIGETLQERAAGNSRKSIVKLMDLRPDFARVVRKGKEEKIAPQEVKVGELTLVLPGERVALDGVVESGSGQLDASALTGESRPVSVCPQDTVLAGCINGDGVLKIRVQKTYENSTVAKILELVENASSKKAPRKNSSPALPAFTRPPWYVPPCWWRSCRRWCWRTHPLKPGFTERLSSWLFPARAR